MVTLKTSVRVLEAVEEDRKDRGQKRAVIAPETRLSEPMTTIMSNSIE